MAGRGRRRPARDRRPRGARTRTPPGQRTVSAFGTIGSPRLNPATLGGNGPRPRPRRIERLGCGQTDRSATNEMSERDAPDALLTPSEVAALFRVNPKTVTRWA